MKHLFMLLLSVVSLLSFVMMIKNPSLPIPPPVFVASTLIVFALFIWVQHSYHHNNKTKVILPYLSDGNFSKLHDNICTNIVILSIHDNTKAHLMLDMYYSQYDSVIERLNDVLKHCEQQDQKIIYSMIKDIKAWQFTMMEGK